jgi:hypothetical protein
MDLAAILTLIVVGGIVWGGFTFFLIRAIKFEKNKKLDE